MSSVPGVGRLIEVARVEGLRALRDKSLDRAAEWRRRTRFERQDTVAGIRAALAAEPDCFEPIPALSYLPTPPAPWSGGVQRALAARMDAQALSKGAALLYPHGHGHRLEVRKAGHSLSLDLDSETADSQDGFRVAGVERVVAQAAHAVGARVLHWESLHEAPFDSIRGLQRQGFRLVLSLHDFSAFCKRPHLLERPTLRFCDYCRDLDRCGRCLSYDWPLNGDFQRRYREAGHDLLRGADALVFPSAFLQRQIGNLFRGLDPARQWLVPPCLEGLTAAETVPLRAQSRVAFVGQVMPHKGAEIFEEVVGGWRDPPGVQLQWLVLGGGDAEILKRLRARPSVSVRGYYRAGRLPALLRSSGVAAAVLPSVVPESYSLTLDECRAAGVPVIAFDLGALGERIRRDGGGLLVPLGEGVTGFLERIKSVVQGVPVSSSRARPLEPGEISRRHEELYEQLL